MADRPAPAVYSVAPHRVFADALAQGLLARFGDDRMAMARGIILVPNNRAATAIQNGFVRLSEKGLLLPRLVPVGDADLGENVGSALDPVDADPISPAIDPLRRQMLLARLLQDESLPGLATRPDGAQAMRLAADLARVLDQLTVERIAPSALKSVDVGAVSDHWQRALDVLDVILRRWPEMLSQLGMIDLADRRNRQLDRVAERWRTSPPPGFVVAAGISTAAPAIAALLKQVAWMEHGMVVLAGLDLALPPEQWAAIGGGEKERAIETHPQYHLHLLLDRMGVGFGEVADWPQGKADAKRMERTARVQQALAPAVFTSDWAYLPEKARTLLGVAALEFDDPAHEAQGIALALRQALETKGQTAALVTPDRMLAERVSAHLARWGIRADDSAGKPLSATPPGSFLLALATAAAEYFAAVPLLALLKHPLSKGDGERLDWLDGARTLDRALRGPQSAPGLAGIDAYLAQDDKRTLAIRNRALAVWPAMRARLDPLEAAFKAGGGLGPLLAALREAAFELAGDALWSGQDGRALSDLFAGLERDADLGPQVSASALPLLLRQALDGVAVRPAAGGHPRLFIWGLLEAKLQNADVMILGGLNEGSWPQLTGSDPWLAPPIRRQLGLVSLEHRIGLASHDLAGASGAKAVLLTRARRDSRAPAIASRLWLRLETFCGGFAEPKTRFDLLARALDHGSGKRCGPPAPTWPPAAERPRKISVTEVDSLKADPYAFYARKVLGLYALDAVGGAPDYKWRGIFLHDVLEQWGDKDKFRPGALKERLLAAFDTSGLHPVIRALWEPRFLSSAETFEQLVADGRAEGREPALVEAEGFIEFGGVRLSGRVDRIDILPSGGLAIIDYKTGEPPSKAKVKSGYALQLGLIGLMAEHGAFAGAKGATEGPVVGPAEAFEYWSQKRNKKTGGYGEVASATGKGKNDIPPEEFVAITEDAFIEAVNTWLLGDEPWTAKLRPDYAFSDYDHVMRYDEWQGRANRGQD